MNGLIRDLNNAPPESEEKLAVLRVLRMMEDKSGRNNEAVNSTWRGAGAMNFTASAIFRRN